MIYDTVASGIETASVAWKGIPGWKPGWFAQFDPEHDYSTGPDFPSAVLAYHYPSVPNLGDMRKILKHKKFNESKKANDLLCGGTPCQAFSIAGLRKGMDDERGNLSLQFCRVLFAKQYRWFLWENVPGVLSSGNNKDGSKCPGKDFSCLLSAWTGKNIVPQEFEKAGIIEGEEGFYSISWRILDSQYFGVPQRRRRLFVVGHIGKDWRPPFGVLFEQESLSGNFKQGKKKRQATSRTTGTSTDKSYFRLMGFGDYEDDQNSSTLQNRDSRGPVDLVVSSMSFQERGGKPGGGKGLLAQDEKTSSLKVKDNQAVMISHRHETVSEVCSPLLSKGSGKGYNHDSAPPVMISVRNSTVNDKGYTLQSGKKGKGYNHDSSPPVMYAIDGDNSNSMKSSNPNSGIYETDAAVTIMTGTPTPDKRQGGNMIVQPVTYDLNQVTHPKNVQNRKSGDPSNTLSKGSPTPALVNEMIIRRLTPLECERLQGLPDNYTNIPWKKKKYSPDGLRYSAIGNGMTSNVMEWIGLRIDMMDKILKQVKNGK